MAFQFWCQGTGLRAPDWASGGFTTTMGHPSKRRDKKGLYITRTYIYIYINMYIKKNVQVRVKRYICMYVCLNECMYV